MYMNSKTAGDSMLCNSLVCGGGKQEDNGWNMPYSTWITIIHSLRSIHNKKEGDIGSGRENHQGVCGYRDVMVGLGEGNLPSIPDL